MNRICRHAALTLGGVAAVRPCILPIHLQASRNARRVFASTPRHRKDDTRARIVAVQDASAKAENKAPPKKEATRNDPLLAEKTVSNTEQRKADWAIIKDMSRYLWPKRDWDTKTRVGLSVALLIGAKVGSSILSSLSYHFVQRC